MPGFVFNSQISNFLKTFSRNVMKNVLCGGERGHSFFNKLNYLFLLDAFCGIKKETFILSQRKFYKHAIHKVEMLNSRNNNQREF